MKILQQLQSRIDKRSNEIVEWEYDHKVDGCGGLYLSWIRKDQTLDKRLYGELLRKLKQNKKLADYIYNLEDNVYGMEEM